MINYPISFFAEAHSEYGMNSPWTIKSQNIASHCAIPHEFEGPGGALSPEDLFAQALTNCFIATFKVYAEKSKVQFSNLSAKTELIVDFDENKKPVMKNCFLRVDIFGCENSEKVRKIADRAFASGFILNSVKTVVKMDLRIES